MKPNMGKIEGATVHQFQSAYVRCQLSSFILFRVSLSENEGNFNEKYITNFLYRDTFIFQFN